MLEIYSDADSAADRQTRRSVLESTVFFGGCLVYSSSLTQKIVSLASESETYAAASATMAAILIASILGLDSTAVVEKQGKFQQGRV